MLRIIHTADVHLGARHDDLGEQASAQRERQFAAFKAAVDLAIAQKVDLFLVAGDLFDSRAPAPEADAILVETLVHLHEAGIPVVAIGGNHDSAQRLEAFAPLYAAVGATVIGNVRRPDAGGVVELPARADGTSALIACVPFVYSDALRAITSVHDRYVETAQTLGANSRQIVAKVLVALALPDIFDSLRHLFGMAFGYIMLAELINAGYGLGFLLMESQRRGPREHIILILIVIGLLAYGIDRLLYFFQRGLFPYRVVED